MRLTMMDDSFRPDRLMVGHTLTVIADSHQEMSRLVRRIQRQARRRGIGLSWDKAYRGRKHYRDCVVTHRIIRG